MITLKVAKTAMTDGECCLSYLEASNEVALVYPNSPGYNVVESIGTPEELKQWVKDINTHHGISEPLALTWTLRSMNLPMPTKFQHIEDIKPKTATNLASAYFDQTDWYHANISQAARDMIDEGKGSWKYITQYSSGSSVWNNPITDESSIWKRDKS